MLNQFDATDSQYPELCSRVEAVHNYLPESIRGRHSGSHTKAIVCVQQRCTSYSKQAIRISVRAYDYFYAEHSILKTKETCTLTPLISMKCASEVSELPEAANTNRPDLDFHIPSQNMGSFSSNSRASFDVSVPSLCRHILNGLCTKAK